MLRPTSLVAALLVSVVAVAACGSDGSHKLVDACTTSGTVTATVTGPANYSCMMPFLATVTVVNNSCDPVDIQGVTLSANVNSSTGNCTPPSAHTYQPAVNVVEPGQTKVVLDLTGGDFCCITNACPADFTCNETFTYMVTTGGDPVMATNSAQISLPNCTVICQGT